MLFLIDQKFRQIKKLPSLFEYFSYIFFGPSAVCGPSFDYKEFNDFINL